MNLILLSLGSLLNSFSAHPSTDTIILRAGNNSKVIFYGKTHQDLKKLELLDLNKILKELNKKQNHPDSVQQQHVILNNSEFVHDQQKPTKIQRYLENTFLNLQIGVGNDDKQYIFFQPATSLLNHPKAILISSIALQNLLTSNLSVMHDMKFVDQPKHVIALRYGVGIGFNIQRYLHWNSLQAVANKDVSEIVPRALELLKVEKIMPLQSDFNAFQSYFQLSPKLSLKNKKGLSTFYFSLGARLNYNRNFQNVNPAAYTAGLIVNRASRGKTKTTGPVTMGGGYAVYSTKSNMGVSYLAEIGYKWLGLFLVYYPDYMPLTTKLIENGMDRPNSGFTNGKKGSIGYVSFGIKLGR